MKKAEALALLKVNNTELAKILCVSRGHLPRIEDLSEAQVKIVQGELAKEILKDAVITIENLEGKLDAVTKRLESILLVVQQQQKH